MNKIRMNKILLVTLILGLSFNGWSQEDSIQVKTRKNIIRWNITPMAVIGPKSFVLGYERVLKNNQSISINAGYLELAPRTNTAGDVVQLFGDVKRSGFDFSVDYRFYFKNRNKFPAPDGLYWGPYTSLYNLKFSGQSHVYDDNNVLINTVGIDAGITMYNIGAQLGYQFIIKDRFSVDLMLMGPSLTRYSFNLAFNADVALDKDDPFYIGMEKLLSTIVPGSEVILDGADFNVQSKTKFNSFGFRYGVQIGYVF
tara:strand:- start:176385 stop:177149 length:765 start_codon:yes stop_codon:yes gene_type:complete